VDTFDRYPRDLPVSTRGNECAICDKQMPAYIRVRGKAVARHVNRFTTYPAISYGDGEKVTNL